MTRRGNTSGTQRLEAALDMMRSITRIGIGHSSRITYKVRHTLLYSLLSVTVPCPAR